MPTIMVGMLAFSVTLVDVVAATALVDHDLA
jgi:hypothetical protein